MNKQNSKNSVIPFVNAIVIMGILVFTIFQFLKGDFEKLVVVDFRMIFAGSIYCIVAIVCFSRIQTIPVGIIMLGAGGFLFYAYFDYFSAGSSFSLHNANFYLIAIAILAGISVILGARLHERNNGLDRLGVNILLPLGAILILLIISDYTLPKPLRIDTTGVVGFMIFMVITIGASIGAYSQKSTGSMGGKISGVFYRLVSFGGLFFCLLWLNNVIYSGCYPSSPIGCKCNINQKEEQPTVPVQQKPLSVIDTVKTETISETVFIPKGGSLWRTLHMRSRSEMLHFAQTNNIKYWYGKKHWLYVMVKPGDAFHKVNGKWEPVAIEIVTKK